MTDYSRPGTGQPTTDPRTYAAHRVYDAETAVRFTRERLISELQQLAETAAREATQLQQDENYLPNSLGIIQSRGPSIDVLAGKLWVQAEALNVLGTVTERLGINTDDPCPRCGGDHDRIDSREPCPTGEVAWNGGPDYRPTM